MSSYQVRSRDLSGNVHDERFTTNEQLAADLARELPNDPEIQDAWYVMVSAV